MSTTASISSPFDISAGKPAAQAGRGAQVQTSPQLLARVTGLLFIITYLTSIPPVLFFYVPALSDPSYILGGVDGGLSWGALLELLLIVANVGSAVALFPVLKRQNEALALGYVTARLIESVFIAIGIISLVALGTLRVQAGGVDTGGLLAVGNALVAIHDWTFRLGPGFIVGIGNGMILGYLMWRSKLVPRALSILGLIGGPLIVLAGAGMLLDIIEPGSIWQGIATVPEFFWELFFGFWLLVKGFSPSALAALPAADSTR